MSERNVEWIIANAINEQARGDPDALALRRMLRCESAGFVISLSHRKREGRTVSSSDNSGAGLARRQTLKSDFYRREPTLADQRSLRRSKNREVSQSMATHQSKAQKETVGRVMHEFKHGELETNTGRKVKNPKQAIAIG
jgi:Family of unknown function (DUF6496)